MIKNKEQIICNIYESLEFKECLEKKENRKSSNLNKRKKLHMIIIKEFINWIKKSNKIPITNDNSIIIEEIILTAWLEELSVYIKLDNPNPLLKRKNLEFLVLTFEELWSSILENWHFFKKYYDFQLILKDGMMYEIKEEADKVAEESSKFCFCWKYLKNATNSIFKSKSNKTKIEEYEDSE